MPQIHKSDERPMNIHDALAAQNARKSSLTNIRGLAKKRAERRGYTRVKIDKTHTSMPGDYTENTPPLRRDAKFRNRLDLPAHAYKLTPHGRCVWTNPDGTTDARFTLMILQHYRAILASRAPFHYMRKDED